MCLERELGCCQIPNRQRARRKGQGQVCRTVLGCAANGGNLEVVKLLIDKGPDVSAKDINGETLLMYAASGGNLT